MFKIGVDIGGSHITSALINKSSGEIFESSTSRSKIDPHDSARNILDSWADTIQKTRNFKNELISSTQQVGFAMPGPFDYSKGISLMTETVAKYENLYGINIRTELANRLNIDPLNFIFRNDAEAFLEGEMHYGAGKGFGSAIGLTLGTGLGTAIYHQHKATDAGLGITHPFLNGVAEEYISTRWFVKRYQEITNQQINGVKQLVETIDRNSVARDILKEFSENISRFILDFIAIHKPDVIIIGGNIAQASEYFFPEIIKRLNDHHHSIPLKKSKLNERAAIIGAIV